MFALDSQVLDERGIVRGLKTHWFGRSLRIVDECASTSDVVAALADNGAAHGLVVIAETQTAGRGRHGKRWHSPRGGLWLSILIKARELPQLVGALPLVGALGVAKALVQGWGVNARVRWPNDVLVGSRKIAGTLVESKSKGNQLAYAILGMGVNVNVETSRIDSIKAASISMSDILGGLVNREGLLCAILSDTEHVYQSLCSADDQAVMRQLGDFDCSRRQPVKVRMVEREIVGIFDGYEGLDRVRIETRHGFESIDTAAVVSVDYQSD